MKGIWHIRFQAESTVWVGCALFAGPFYVLTESICVYYSKDEGPTSLAGHKDDPIFVFFSFFLFLMIPSPLLCPVQRIDTCTLVPSTIAWKVMIPLRVVYKC